MSRNQKARLSSWVMGIGRACSDTVLHHYDGVVHKLVQ